MGVKTVAVVGAGTMGNGIAQASAMAGHEVRLIDLSSDQLDRALAQIDKSLSRFVKSQAIDEAAKTSILGRIRPGRSLEEASGAELVIEAVFEDLNIKIDIFRTLDRICSPETVLASNTSSLPITGLAAATGRSGKVLGMHFMNPVPIMKGVELIRGRRTSDETVEFGRRFVESLGKVATVAQDYAGFITSRILNAYLNETAWTVMDGNSPEDIDKGMVYCTNMPTGPCRLMDMVGIDVIVRVLGVLEEEFGPRFKPAPILKQMVRAGEIGVKSKRGFYEYDR